MNILIFDKDTRKYKGNISQIASLIWTERYWECGDFELVLPLSLKFYSKFQLGDYFKIATSNTVMVVEQVEVTSAVNTTEGSINIKGRSLESILDRRVLFEEFENKSHPSVYIPQLITKCFTGEGRTVDYLMISSNSNIIVDNSDGKDEEDLSISASRGDNLYSLVNSASIAAEIGFRILFDNNDGTMIFLLYEGSDKTYMRFSELSLTLNEANLYRSIEQLRNYVLVDGKNDDDSNRTVTVYDYGSQKEEPKGLARREYLIDYSVGRYENESDKKYDSRLKLKGNEALEEYKETMTAEGKLLSVGKWKIRKDFDLGDVVTLHNDFFTAEARITEIIQSWDYADGYQIYPGFIVKNVKLSTIGAEYEKPVEPIVPPEPDEPEPETPDIPVDQTPRKLINVEIISAIKMYTNFIAGGTSRTYHQIYIPNYDPSEPDNRPIKRFGVRLRGLLPEGWDAGLYSVYCDIFLGSEQKLETIKVAFNPGDRSFVGNWYSYLTYDSPYIRLYLYVIANEVGQADILDDQEPFMNGLVDIRLNNVEDQEYVPSEEGDQLTCQTTYIWENNGNFHRYFSGNSTNVTGIQNVDITVIRQNSMANESMLTELDQVIDSGGRIWEYDTSSLDNTELIPVDSGVVEVTQSGGNYNVPAIGEKFEGEEIGELGWRQNIAEYVKSNLIMSRFAKGSNSQEMNLLFKKHVPAYNPEEWINGTYVASIELDSVCRGDKEISNDSVKLTFDNSEKKIKTLYIKSKYTGKLSSESYNQKISIYGDDEEINSFGTILTDYVSFAGLQEYTKLTVIISVFTPVSENTNMYYGEGKLKVNYLLIFNKTENQNPSWTLNNIFWPRDYTVKIENNISTWSKHLDTIFYLYELIPNDQIQLEDKIIFKSVISELINSYVIDKSWWSITEHFSIYSNGSVQKDYYNKNTSDVIFSNLIPKIGKYEQMVRASNVYTAWQSQETFNIYGMWGYIRIRFDETDQRMSKLSKSAYLFNTEIDRKLLADFTI